MREPYALKGARTVPGKGEDGDIFSLFDCCWQGGWKQRICHGLGEGRGKYSGGWGKVSQSENTAAKSQNISELVANRPTGTGVSLRMMPIIETSVQIIEKEGITSFVIHGVKFVQRCMRIGYQDLKNRIKYGPDAPIYGERIWINPSDVNNRLRLSPNKFLSGQVVDTWPPNGEQPKFIADNERFRCCVSHFVNGIAWEDTGIYEHVMIEIAGTGGRMVDGCINRDDIIERYRRLDIIFGQIKRERKIRTRKEINPLNFRECGGIYVHIGPRGELFFGDIGNHRFCIAYILGLSTVPVQIGCVHQSAIPLLPILRRKPDFPQ